jgi:23S rRNA pseudouridine1911/1915/1917 synthase
VAVADRRAAARLEIVEETADYLVVNKPGGLVCHPTKGDQFSSLIGRLRLYFSETDDEPRFVHRLDRETSGLVLISKNRPVHKTLCRELEQSEKVYLAVVEGEPGAGGVIDEPLGKALESEVVVKQAVVPNGKASITEWMLLDSRNGFSLVRLVPRTGRMHQLRVHMQWLGFPIVGDKLYGADETLYLEFTEKDWTQRHERTLAARRQLLTAVSIATPSFQWSIDPPEDLASFQPWLGGWGAL